ADRRVVRRAGAESSRFSHQNAPILRHPDKSGSPLKLSATRIVVPLVLLAATVAAVATPGVLGTKFTEAVTTARDADRDWLALAMLGFAGGFLACVAPWRAALAAFGGRVSAVRGAAGLGVGSLVNTFAPARLGDVVKIALFSRAIDGPERLWTAGGVYAA